MKGASENNLRIWNYFPLGVITAVTGVSGGGKSTLVNEILYKARSIYGAKDKPGRRPAIEGAEQIDKVISIDQSPIGRTPRAQSCRIYRRFYAHTRYFRRHKGRASARV